MIQKQDRTATLARFNGTHHSRCTRTDYNDVLLQGHNRIVGKPDLIPMDLLYATRSPATVAVRAAGHADDNNE